MYCNDIDARNLAVIHNRFVKNIPDTNQLARLNLLPAAFPYELAAIPSAYFDAILICRVLHFFSGETILQSMQLASTWLKPGGKIFVVCETPYLKNWQAFMPEFAKRVADGHVWPGEIHEPAKYESSGRAASLPAFVHWQTIETLLRLFAQIPTVTVEKAAYIDRHGQFPSDLLLDGRESIGVVATRNN